MMFNRTHKLLFLAALFANLFLYAQETSVFKNIQTTSIKPISITEIKKNHYFFDFGKDAFGKIFIHIDNPIDDTLLIHAGERLNAANEIHRNPGGTIRFQTVRMITNTQQKDYIIPFVADKRNSNPPAIILPDSFGVVMPFRYVEIENLKCSIQSVTVKQIVYHHQFNDEASYFYSSDTVLNKVWDLCKYSIKATSFCGVYVDGDRERIPYEADAYINQLGHYAVDNNYSMARNTNEYFMHHPTWPTEWILHTVLLFYYDYLYTGDIAPIVNHYDKLKVKTLMDLEREDGLISSHSSKVDSVFMQRLGFKDSKLRIRDIVDWPPSQSETGWRLATPEGERDGYEMMEVNTVVNAFYYINLKLMAEMAGAIGKDEDSVRFLNMSVRTLNTINEKLFDKTRGIYVDGEKSSHASIHANMIPLAFGIVPKDKVASVVAHIKSRGMACSVYGAQYLLEGLYRAGEAEYALSLMTAKHDRSWWNMIQLGSTITMEAWDMKYKPNSDWNHAWGAAPANIIPMYLWGIRPMKQGQKSIVIHPQLANLTESKIKVPFKDGYIVAEYKKLKNGNELFTFDIPAEFDAEFIRSNVKGKVYLNNTITPFDGALKLMAGFTIIEFKK